MLYRVSFQKQSNKHGQHTEEYYIKRDTIYDDAKTWYNDNIDDLPIEIWADVTYFHAVCPCVIAVPITANSFIFTVL